MYVYLDNHKVYNSETEILHKEQQKQCAITIIL